MRRTLPLLVAVLLAAAGCAKVTESGTDKTPPTLTWRVQSAMTGTVRTFTTNGTLTGAPGDSFRVTLTATDPQGIHQIEVNGGFGGSCASVTGGDSVDSDGVFLPQTQTLEPDSHHQVLTSIFLVETMSFSQDCGTGFIWVGGSGSLQGSAENYHGGTANGIFSVVEGTG